MQVHFTRFFFRSKNRLILQGMKILLCFFIIKTIAFSKNPDTTSLPPAQEIAAKMKVGWNLGNTLEAICGETAWGNPTTTQRLIDSVKAAGYDAIRLPCAWYCHSDHSTNEIDSTWIARVKEVVDYCINDSLYVILNIHWDSGWLENHVTTADSAEVKVRQHDYWTQIANYFIEYDEYLLFAGANEPNVNNVTEMRVLLAYHQTFINAVRATGGNNSSRTLIIQGPSTDIDKTNSLMKTLPNDSIADRLMVEIHYYTPWQFCGLTEDADWGKMFYYWGKNYHSTTDASRNATWGEESAMDNYFNLMKTKFVDEGIPVILGEYGVVKRTLSGESDQELHLASRLHFYQYMVKSAVSKGLIPFNWDTGPYGNNTMGIFDRNTGEAVDRDLLDAIMQGVDSAATDIPDEGTGAGLPTGFRLEQNYPNPFNPATVIRWQLAVGSHVNLSIYNILGQKVVTLVNRKQNAGNHSVLFNASSLAGGLYFYRLEAGLNHETKKLLLIR